MIFYFSGCGNSRHVAETLAQGLNDTLVFIPEAARAEHYDYTLADDELLGFVFPWPAIYGVGLALLVLSFFLARLWRRGRQRKQKKEGSAS